jgi:hypothetical protein
MARLPLWSVGGLVSRLEHNDIKNVLYCGTKLILLLLLCLLLLLKIHHLFTNWVSWLVVSRTLNFFNIVVRNNNLRIILCLHPSLQLLVQTPPIMLLV